MVLWGNVGPWKGMDEKTIHQHAPSAKEFIEVAMLSYCNKARTLPKELFVHRRTRYTGEEWSGFNQVMESCGRGTNLVGVTIYNSDSFRLYKDDHSSKFA